MTSMTDVILLFLSAKYIHQKPSVRKLDGQIKKVRKGKGLLPEYEEAMIEAGVPDWYIWSCKKIKYMFPKAHAAAYVMMAYRIAYCKVNYPLAYYAAFFSIRATAFSYELMCQGRDVLEEHMRDYEKRMDTLTPDRKSTRLNSSH